jgi:hypothetical protein
VSGENNNMTGHNDHIEAEKFEKGLRNLLKRSYKPVESRREFKQSLFAELQQKQHELAAKRTKSRKIKHMIFSISAAAASVAIVLGISISSNNIEPAENNVNNLSIAATAKPKATDTEAILKNKISPVHNKIENTTIAATNNYSVKKISFDKKSGLISSPYQQTGLKIATGTRLIMGKGGQIKINGKNHITVNKGLLSFRLEKEASPLTVDIGKHQLVLKPGAWLGMDVKDNSLYAPEGSPAPDVTLMEGEAQIKNKNTNGTLLAGHTYRLHPYLAITRLDKSDIQGELHSKPTTWIKPTLVNYQVVPER